MNKKMIGLVIILMVGCFFIGFFVKANIKEKPAAPYFPEAKITKEQQTTKTLQTLQKLIDDENVPDIQKVEATEKFTQIAKRADSETRIELLLKGINFEDAICFIKDNKVMIIVKSNKKLKDEEVNKIRDIVITQTNFKDIEITTKK